MWPSALRSYASASRRLLIVGIPFQNSALGYTVGGPFNAITGTYLHGADLAYYVGGAVAFLIYWFGARSAVKAS